MTQIIAAVIGIAGGMLAVWLKVYLEKKRPYNPNKVKVKDHALFGEMDYWIKIKIDMIKTNNTTKTTMVRKFLKIKIGVFNKRLYELAERVDSGEHVHDSNGIKTFFANCIKEYEDKARQEGIPDIFIDKFSEWHACTIETLFEGVEYLCNNPAYGSCKEKYNAILGMMYFALHMTMLHAEKTMLYFNGELDKVLDV